MTPAERAEAEKELAEDPLADEPEGGLGGARIAFGPFLSLATIECLFVGRETIASYFSWIDPG
jgi:leader peptidase (prepilin peptidase)/N-methyltransferase